MQMLAACAQAAPKIKAVPRPIAELPAAQPLCTAKPQVFSAGAERPAFGHKKARAVLHRAF